MNWQQIKEIKSDKIAEKCIIRDGTTRPNKVKKITLARGANMISRYITYFFFDFLIFLQEKSTHKYLPHVG